MYLSSIILSLSDFGLFHGLLITVLGSQCDFHGCRTPSCAYVLVVKPRSLGLFWPISWTTTRFWGPEVISTIDEPRVAFMCRSSTLTILAILVHFVDFYSPVWGPSVILTIEDPRGAFTSPSSTLIVLANSDPFLRLLLTILGSRSDFHSC